MTPTKNKAEYKPVHAGLYFPFALQKVAVATLCIVCLVCCSCQTQNDTDKPMSLKGTKWKLKGIVNTETGTLKVLEPKNCVKCYTFTFDTDTTALGYSVLNEMFIRGLNPVIIVGTKVGEEGDAGIYYKALFSVHSCTFNRSELKLFFNNNKEYLLFKHNQ